MRLCVSVTRSHESAPLGILRMVMLCVLSTFVSSLRACVRARESAFSLYASSQLYREPEAFHSKGNSEVTAKMFHEFYEQQRSKKLQAVTAKYKEVSVHKSPVSRRRLEKVGSAFCIMGRPVPHQAQFIATSCLCADPFTHSVQDQKRLTCFPKCWIPSPVGSVGRACVREPQGRGVQSLSRRSLLARPLYTQRAKTK